MKKSLVAIVAFCMSQAVIAAPAKGTDHLNVDNSIAVQRQLNQDLHRAKPKKKAEKKAKFLQALKQLYDQRKASF